MGHKIQVGQVWKQDETGDLYLVTKIYSEALTTIAVMRKTGSEMDARIRAKVERHGDDFVLQGFSFAQHTDES